MKSPSLQKLTDAIKAMNPKAENKDYGLIVGMINKLVVGGKSRFGIQLTAKQEKLFEHLETTATDLILSGCKPHELEAELVGAKNSFNNIPNGKANIESINMFVFQNGAEVPFQYEDMASSTLDKILTAIDEGKSWVDIENSWEDDGGKPITVTTLINLNSVDVIKYWVGK